MKLNETYTYDDVQLVPKYSDIQSRSHINLETRLSRNFNIKVPYVAAPMDTICGLEMAKKLASMGGVGCIHRFMSIEDQCEAVLALQGFLYEDKGGDISAVWGDTPKPIMAAVGVGDEGYGRSRKLIESNCNVLVIDVAHGHHQNVRDLIYRLKTYREEESVTHFDIIAGNIATKEAAFDLMNWGADGLRVGIGGGSLCTTRVQTGHGVPNITSIIEVCKKANLFDVPVMADGGIRSSGDIAKALSAGADCVMLGSLLAGTQETPGEVIEKGNHLYKRYRGSASLETKVTHGQEERNVEGESTVIPFKGGVKYVIHRLNDGIRSALSYSGSHNISEYQRKSEMVLVTNAGLTEGKPHRLI